MPLTTFEKTVFTINVIGCAAISVVYGICWYAMWHGAPLRGSFQAGCRLLGLM